MLLSINVSCSNNNTHKSHQRAMGVLQSNLSRMIADSPAKVGVAVITSEGDTLTLNNTPTYAMMSVFKLHQALAVARVLDEQGLSLDTPLSFTRTELNVNTWSPMLKDLAANDVIELPVSKLLEYTLQVSDNNASNLLFSHILSPQSTDSVVRRLTGIDDFTIRHSEADMQRRHELSYDNCTSPLAAAELVNQLFNQSVVSAEVQQFICMQLSLSPLTSDRLGAPFAERSEVKFAHKSGSGYTTPDGVLIACNDVGYVQLPDGKHYAIAVLVRDYAGPQEDAVLLIARISQEVYDYISSL